MLQRHGGLWTLAAQIDRSKALGVFRDPHELLERRGRAWYPNELRERGKKALRLLRQGLENAKPADLPNDVANIGDESPGKQEIYNRAELDYACEKLHLAVRSAMRSEQALTRRLVDCYLELHTLNLRRGLPADLQQQFDAMMEAWTRSADPSGEQWTAAAMIEKMNDEEARPDVTLNLFVEMIKRKALADAV